MPRTTLAPLDGSLLVEHGLPPARNLARDTGALLMLPWAGVAARFLGPSAHEGEECRQAMWYRLAGERFSVRAEARHGHPVRAIAFSARTHGAEPSVMTSHGQTGPRRSRTSHRYPSR